MQKGGLSGTGGPDDGNHFPFFDIEIDPFDYLKVPVIPFDVFGLDHVKPLQVVKVVNPVDRTKIRYFK